MAAWALAAAAASVCGSIRGTAGSSAATDSRCSLTVRSASSDMARATSLNIWARSAKNGWLACANKGCGLKAPVVS